MNATRFTITGLPEHLSTEQAEAVLEGMLVQLREQMPASPDYRGQIQVALDAINDARGTEHTPESVAKSLGIDLSSASEADASRIARHIGGVLMR